MIATIIISIVLIILLIINYYRYFESLVNTYNHHLKRGKDVYYDNIYFNTKKELFIHMIPYYYFYLDALKMIRTYKKLN